MNRHSAATECLGVIILELPVQHLAILFCAAKIKELFLVIEDRC